MRSSWWREVESSYLHGGDHRSCVRSQTQIARLLKRGLRVAVIAVVAIFTFCFPLDQLTSYQLACVVHAVPLVPGRNPPPAAAWKSRRVILPGRSGELREDSIDLRSKKAEGCKSKRIRILRGLLLPGEAKKIYDLAVAKPFSALDSDVSPVKTPLNALAIAGVWRSPVDPLANAVEPVVEGRLLPYMRKVFKCPSLTVAQVMVRRYESSKKRNFDIHYDHHALGTAVLDLTPEAGSGLFVGSGADAASQFFVPLTSPDDVVVHGWNVVHGVRLREGHERVSLVVWVKPLLDIEKGTTSWYGIDADADAAFRMGLEAQQEGDADAARMQFSRAADQGHVYSMYYLSKVLEEITDFYWARRWLEEAAAAEFAPAQVDLGDALQRDGDGASALNMFEMAASQGNSRAIQRLSAALLSGLGVPPESHADADGQEKTCALFERAKAEHRVGNDVAAVRLLHEAALSGHAEAAKQLAGLADAEKASTELKWTL